MKFLAKENIANTANQIENNNMIIAKAVIGEAKDLESVGAITNEQKAVAAKAKALIEKPRQAEARLVMHSLEETANTYISRRVQDKDYESLPKFNTMDEFNKFIEQVFDAYKAALANFGKVIAPYLKDEYAEQAEAAFPTIKIGPISHAPDFSNKKTAKLYDELMARFYNEIWEAGGEAISEAKGNFLMANFSTFFITEQEWNEKTQRNDGEYRIVKHCCDNTEIADVMREAIKAFRTAKIEYTRSLPNPKRVVPTW